MSSSSIATPKALSEQQLTVCREFIDSCLEQLRESLEMLLGHPMTIALEEAIVESDIAIRVRMPASGGACTMKASVDGKISFLMMELPLAQALLALSRADSEEDVKKARDDAAELTQGDRNQLAEVGKLFAAAFGDTAMSRTEGRMGFEAAGVLAIRDSSWVDGEDPVEPIDYITLTGSMVIGANSSSDPFNLLIPEQSLGRILPEFSSGDDVAIPASEVEPEPPPVETVNESAKAPDPEPGPSRVSAPPAPEAPVAKPMPASPPPREAHGNDLGCEGASILCLSASGQTGALGDACTGNTIWVQTPSSLLQHLESGTRTDLVVAVVGQQELHLLKLLAALKQHPALLHVPILILLEHPTPRRILLCGQLGLYRVLPATSAPDEIKSRFEQSLQADSPHHS